jgi:hypothetical protein
MDRLTSSWIRPSGGARRAPRRARGRRVAICVAAVCACALAAPAASYAGSLTVAGTCFASGQRIAVSGTAFSPGGTVALGGRVAGAAQVNTAGEFATTVTAPAVTELGPQVVPVTAVDQANPANTATTQIRVVRQAFGSNLPVAGRPDEVTTWRFAGFATGRPIYAHFLLEGQVRGDHRFGVARGDCGTLTARAARIPGVAVLQAGRWTIRLDQRRTYRAGTPGSVARFRIFPRR